MVKEETAGWVLPLHLSRLKDNNADFYWDLNDCEVDGGYILRMRMKSANFHLTSFSIFFNKSFLKEAKKLNRKLQAFERNGQSRA